MIHAGVYRDDMRRRFVMWVADERGGKRLMLERAGTELVWTEQQPYVEVDPDKSLLCVPMEFAEPIINAVVDLARREGLVWDKHLSQQMHLQGAHLEDMRRIVAEKLRVPLIPKEQGDVQRG